MSPGVGGPPPTSVVPNRLRGIEHLEVVDLARGPAASKLGGDPLQQGGGRFLAWAGRPTARARSAAARCRELINGIGRVEFEQSRVAFRLDLTASSASTSGAPNGRIAEQQVVARLPLDERRWPEVQQPGRAFGLLTQFQEVARATSRSRMSVNRSRSDGHRRR